MIIDDKGRLFGKINLLDIILICMALLIAAAVSVFYLNSASDTDSKKKTINPETAIALTYTVEVKDRDAAYFENIQKGDLVTDKLNRYMGRIVEVSTQQATILTQADDQLLLSPVENKYDGSVKIRVTAEDKKPDVVLLNKQAVKIGKDFDILSNGVAIDGFVIDVDYDRERYDAISQTVDYEEVKINVR